MILLSLIAVIVAFGIGTAFGVVIMSGEIDQYVAEITDPSQFGLYDAAREVVEENGSPYSVEKLREVVEAMEMKGEIDE